MREVNDLLEKALLAINDRTVFTEDQIASLSEMIDWVPAAIYESVSK